MKFDRFLSSYKADSESALSSVHPAFLYGVRGARELYVDFDGSSFNSGVYRLLAIESIDHWTKVVTEAFPSYRGKITCFGRDWLGRFFALDATRRVAHEPAVSIFEPGTGEVLEAPVGFAEFHNEEMVEFPDAAVANDAFEKWAALNPVSHLSDSECVGYKVPLFLGGNDDFANMEVVDIEVYWGLCSQLLSSIR